MVLDDISKYPCTNWRQIGLVPIVQALMMRCMHCYSADLTRRDSHHQVIWHCVQNLCATISWLLIHSRYIPQWLRDIEVLQNIFSRFFTTSQSSFVEVSPTAEHSCDVLLATMCLTSLSSQSSILDMVHTIPRIASHLFIDVVPNGPPPNCTSICTELSSTISGIEMSTATKIHGKIIYEYELKAHRGAQCLMAGSSYNSTRFIPSSFWWKCT